MFKVVSKVLFLHAVLLFVCNWRIVKLLKMSYFKLYLAERKLNKCGKNTVSDSAYLNFLFVFKDFIFLG